MTTDESIDLAYRLQLEELLGAADRIAILDESQEFTAAGYFLPAAAARRHQQELQLDQDQSEALSEKLLKEQQLWQDEELARRINDEEYASDLSNSSYSESQVFDLFFAQWEDDRGYVGVGCVIKDTDSQVVFQSRECIGIDVSHHFAEYTALINGLAFARSAGVKRINAYGNRSFIYWEVEGRAEAWTVEQLNSIDALRKQIKELDIVTINCVPRTETEDAIKLAKYAAEHEPEIKSKLMKAPLGKEDDREGCLICLEKIFASDMVHKMSCDHRFCFSCLSQHVEIEISSGKVPVRCPQFLECARNMGPDDCQFLISPKVFDIYSSRLTEATISDSEKVYCPFPGCSAMMCWNEGNRANSNAASSSSILRKTNISSAECMECHRLFCVECQVPWHADLTCRQYQQLPPDERDAEDRKLFQLAKDQKWRKCKKCRSLIILAEGCFHMTCRCGNEFCYTCGIDYRNRRPMCTCPLFPE